MSRPRRSGRRASGRRARIAGDWVYRGTGEFSTTPGSYQGNTYLTVIQNSVATGTINSTVMVLYDSQDYLVKLTTEGAGAPTGMPLAARAEGRRPMVHRVQGTMTWTPVQGWAAGAAWAWGYRLMWCEQDSATGGALLEVPYSMWEPEVAAAVPHYFVTIYANDTLLNMREVRRAIGFDTSMPQRQYTEYINWRPKIRTAPSSKHALFMYVEAPNQQLLATGASQMRLSPNLRSFVSDEG